MREYGKVSGQFWIGETGKEIRALGADAQRLALYLMTSPHSNMLGLYYLPMPAICHEVGISKEGASKGLLALKAVNFAHYHEPTEHVWVPRMAYYQIGAELKGKDKRIAGVEKAIEEYRKSVFFNDFLREYGAAYSLSTRPSVPSPFEAPSKPLRSQEQEQEQEIEQEQETKRARLGEQKTEDVSGQAAAPSSARFRPPTIDQVAAYCAERKNRIDAKQFVDFYTARGWKHSKGIAMKDWKAAVRTWEANDRERSTKGFYHGKTGAKLGAGQLFDPDAEGDF